MSEGWFPVDKHHSIDNNSFECATQASIMHERGVDFPDYVDISEKFVAAPLFGDFGAAEPPRPVDIISCVQVLYPLSYMRSYEIIFIKSCRVL